MIGNQQLKRGTTRDISSENVDRSVVDTNGESGQKGIGDQQVTYAKL